MRLILIAIVLGFPLVDVYATIGAKRAAGYHCEKMPCGKSTRAVTVIGWSE